MIQKQLHGWHMMNQYVCMKLPDISCVSVTKWDMCQGVACATPPSHRIVRAGLHTANYLCMQVNFQGRCFLLVLTGTYTNWQNLLSASLILMNIVAFMWMRGPSEQFTWSGWVVQTSPPNNPSKLRKWKPFLSVHSKKGVLKQGWSTWAHSPQSCGWSGVPSQSY